MPAGYICRIKGVARVNDSGNVDLRSASGLRWSLAWSTQPSGLDMVATGDMIQVDGRCDKSSRPFTLWAAEVVLLAPPSPNPPNSPSTSDNSSPGNGDSSSSGGGNGSGATPDSSDESTDWWMDWGGYLTDSSPPPPVPAASPSPSPRPSPSPVPSPGTGSAPASPVPTPSQSPRPSPSARPSPPPSPSPPPPPSPSLPPPSPSRSPWARSSPPPSPSPPSASPPSPRASPSPSPSPRPSPPPGARPSPSARADVSAAPWPALVTSVPVKQTLTSLVVAVDFCDARATFDMNLVKAVWSKTLPAYFANASFGAMAMPNDVGSNNVQTQRVQIGCSGRSLDGVSWTSRSAPDMPALTGWAEAADIAVAQRGLDIHAYRHHVYLMPPSIGTVSFGAGNYPASSYVPLRVWGAGSDTNVNVVNMVHELGHNLGLLHSQGYGSNGVLGEYGDASCPMGSAPVPTHYNAPNSVALGWTTPQAVLRAPDLPVGTWGFYRLRGLADSAVSSLQIFPGTWNSSWRPTDQLFISFRRYTPTNGDSGLLPAFRNKVQLHSFAQEPDGCRCAPSVLLANLDAVNSTVWPKPGSTAPGDAAAPLLVVKVMEVDETAGLALIGVCRRGNGNSNSCAL